MIDYEKLKIAHELIEKIHLGKFHMTLSTHDGVAYRFYVPINESFSTICLDELIEYLRELTKTEPKYKCGDIVWFTYEGDMCSALVKQSRIIDGEVSYLFDEFIPIRECDLFPTRQALIENQIAYWQSMRELKIPDPPGELCKYTVNNCKHDWEDATEYYGASKRMCKICKTTEIYSNECQHECSEALLSNPPWYKCLKCGELYK